MSLRDLPLNVRIIRLATGGFSLQVIQGDFMIGSIGKRYDGWRVLSNTSGRRGNRKGYPTPTIAAKSFWGAKIASLVETTLNNELKVVVTLDVPGVTGDRPPTISRFETVVEAEDFLATSSLIDQEYLHAGYYGIDAPEEMVNPK